MTDAFPWDEAPSLPSSDCAAFTMAGGHVERLIGSIRRESLDHLVVFDEEHLRRFLKSYASYYNQVIIANRIGVRTRFSRRSWP